jgi:hypothetical protein
VPVPAGELLPGEESQRATAPAAARDEPDAVATGELELDDRRAGTGGADEDEEEESVAAAREARRVRADEAEADAS